jgi:hypothetical protein
MPPPRLRKTIFSLIGISAVTALTFKVFYYGCFVTHASTSQLISIHMISRHGARTRKQINSRFIEDSFLFLIPPISLILAIHTIPGLPEVR